MCFAIGYAKGLLPKNILIEIFFKKLPTLSFAKCQFDFDVIFFLFFVVRLRYVVNLLIVIVIRLL